MLSSTTQNPKTFHYHNINNKKTNDEQEETKSISTSTSTTPSAEPIRVPKDITNVTFDPTITEISDRAFFNCTKLKVVTALPPNLEQIGNYAFYDCSNLSYIHIPPAVKDIGNAAFDGCTELRSIVIPPTVSKIRYRMFYRCTNLTCVVLPSASIKDIRNNAFSDCENLVLIIIPDSVKSVMYSAFENCHVLKQVMRGQQHHHQQQQNANNELYDDIESLLRQRFLNLPLHQICYDSNVTFEQIVQFIQDQQDGNIDNVMSKVDALGMTALHVLACNPNATPEMLNLVVDKCPITTTMKTMHDMTPIELYVQCNEGRRLSLSLSSKATATSIAVPSVDTSAVATTLFKNTYENNVLPLLLALKMGMKWKEMKDFILECNPLAIDGRGMKRHPIKDDDSGICGDDKRGCSDYDETALYPFMHAAIYGDLESLYNLSLCGVDLIYH